MVQDFATIRNVFGSHSTKSSWIPLTSTKTPYNHYKTTISLTAPFFSFKCLLINLFFVHQIPSLPGWSCHLQELSGGKISQGWGCAKHGEQSNTTKNMNHLGMTMDDPWNPMKPHEKPWNLNHQRDVFRGWNIMMRVIPALGVTPFLAHFFLALELHPLVNQHS